MLLIEEKEKGGGGLPMETSVAAATVLATILDLVAKKGYRVMALLVSYPWLCVTTSLAFFIRFLAKNFFGAGKEEERYKHGGSISSSTRPPAPIAKARKPGKEEEEKERSGEEREIPGFQFRFSFQIPEQSTNNRGVQGGSAGEDGGSSMATSISNYRFFSDRDCRGFMEAPQAMTLHVHESHIDSDGIVRSSPEELDRELKNRLSSLKHCRQVDAGIRTAAELDRELSTRLLSVKLSERYDSNVEAPVHAEEQLGVTLFPDNLSRADAYDELEPLDVSLPNEADALARARLFCVPLWGFGDLDSDSDSESRSDGYSVKDLTLGFDSDGFFSERDLEAEADRARFLVLDGEEGYEETEQKTKATQLPSSLDSAGSLEDYDGEAIELLENTRKSCTEIKLEDPSNSISSSDLHDDVVSSGIVLNSTVELDRELKSRFSSVKCPRQADANVGAAKELDRELKCRLLSVKFSQRHNSDVRAARHEETQDHKSLYHENLSSSDVSEELELIDFRLSDKVDAPAVSQLFPVQAGEFSVFNSDSESESGSDGYPVKDLFLDFDTDGLFSEKDFEADSGKEGSLDLEGEEEDDYAEYEQKSTVTQLLNSLGSVGGSRDFDVVSDGDLGPAELESEQFQQEETDQKEAINGSSYTDELSSITSHVGSGTQQLVKIQPERIPSESGQEEIDQFELEESESSDSREPKGIELSNSCGVDKESLDFGIYQNMKNSSLSNQVLSEEASATTNSNSERVSGQEIRDAAEAGDELKQGLEGPWESEETHFEESEELSMEEEEELESLWEHQDLIDRLKMDLRKGRATGLPTILEESESLRPAEGLKPWKHEARFLREDPMDEMHKFYKSYRERMKKFDVLNYQKMHALGFLQLKDPLQSIGTQKPFIPTIASILSHNFWRRKSGTDSSEKFIKELRSDLETAYVGQMCLSWEFLRWQYERSWELLGSNRCDSRRYNQVAEEYQQFQVLIQRFLENEPFQGPRIINYTKNRCVLRKLIQVPVIKEDCFKDKADDRRKQKDAITGEQLEYIIEDSIRIFWEFVKSDKDEASLIMKGLFGTHVELQDPTDLEFMVDIQANLKQKQKKLKDVLRTGNCLVKKFKKPQPGRSNQDDLFFSQVDLKLVSKVLKITRITTDQLVWCHKKLSKISFVDRKVMRESSFLLFPC